MSGSRSRAPCGRSSSLQNLQSLSHALSPPAQAAASAGTAAALSIALTACTTIEEIVAVIPTHYSDSVAPFLRTMADNVERATSTRRQRQELAEAATSGNFPKWLSGSIGVLSFQPMKAYTDTAAGATMIAAYRTARETARKRSMEVWVTST